MIKQNLPEYPKKLRAPAIFKKNIKKLKLERSGLTAYKNKTRSTYVTFAKHNDYCICEEKENINIGDIIVIDKLEHKVVKISKTSYGYIKFYLN